VIDVWAVATPAFRHERAFRLGTAACVLVGGMTLAVLGATGFVAPAQRAVIGYESESR
jgi:hypothetical protein